jgi:hypothetical protein
MSERFFAVLRMHRYFSAPVRELLFQFGMWRPKTFVHGLAAERFSEVNRQFWRTIPSEGKNILIEGHLAEYGPNYLFRTGLVAKAIQELYGGGVATVVTNGFSFQWQNAKICYNSFCITNWIFLGRRFLIVNPFLILLALLRALWSIKGISEPRQLIDLKHGGIKVGDLVYDEILRRSKQPTVRAINLTVFINIARSWFYYYQYHLLFCLKKYHFYIATHTAYPEYGLLCRVALQRDVIVIETSDIQMSLYRSIGEDNLPTYHHGINSRIQECMRVDHLLMPNYETAAKENLNRRFNAELDQIDAIKAYSGKVYQRAELFEKLNISPGKKLGFVLAHIFIDSPHLSNHMLHNDYYDWLISTIDCCKEATEVVWLIKPHPSRALYGEDGMIESLVKDSKALNVYMCPPDLNTSSLVTCADVILTVHGTAGLEFSCLGIPVVLAGSPFYAGFGFTHEPKSRNDYRKIIKNAHKLEPLSSAQTSSALQVFGVWNTVFDWNNPVITSQLLANVWGSGTQRNLEAAFDILTENLKKNDPRKLKLWKFAIQVARDELLYAK